MNTSPLNNVTAPDAYSEKFTVAAAGAQRVRLTINNQPIYWQRGYGIPGGTITWSESEEFLTPGLYSLEDPCDAVRIRAAVPAAQIPATGLQAQVSVALRSEP